MKTRYVLQVGMLALGLVLVAANGATANHGFSLVGGVCSEGEFNTVHTEIDNTYGIRNAFGVKLLDKLQGSVDQVNKGATTKGEKKLVDIKTKVESLKTGRGQPKKTQDDVEVLLAAVADAINCI